MLTAHRPIIAKPTDYQRLYYMSLAREGRYLKKLRIYMAENAELAARVKELSVKDDYNIETIRNTRKTKVCASV
jgi:hypothetical protein